MRALTWHGRRDVRVDTVPDPKIIDPTDVIVRVTSSGICGSDLHLYELLGPYLEPGDILGHEPMGIVEEVGSQVRNLAVGDRVVVPFNVSCGTCWMCSRGLQSQCETTQVTKFGSGGSLFGYTKLYGQIPGGQAEFLRVPFGDTLPIKVPHTAPDQRYLYLSDVLPTAWQGVAYADVPPGGSVAVLGLGPIGDMATRIALHQGAGQVIGVDLVPERLARASERGVTTLEFTGHGEDIGDRIRELTDGRGADAVIEAVGMEAHGAPLAKAAQRFTGLLPDPLGQKLMTNAGIDSMTAFNMAVDAVRRGGTISILGVYGGAVDPVPMLTLFDKQVQLRMGQANVRRWVDDILPLLDDSDPLGVDHFATHTLSLEDGPEAYSTFQAKRDGMVKAILTPDGGRPSPV
ncbi:zinc-dependent alcohol dehydrogenase [Streptomyces palmae]|uniref:Glutathione-dependent formaldehyde dehydrogenase n=1 Tax=Streptomyces palmae TaxID=1701085 RepID=A0A4Z0HC04_9ACTN|nr:zinc-dependent alcohol dehydrogenase [Streptomyces palmae]TGB16984.1 glutathione-dependent formaldehyde dehydrogenase [Streptomyces palmae]